MPDKSVFSDRVFSRGLLHSMNIGPKSNFNIKNQIDNIIRLRNANYLLYVLAGVLTLAPNYLVPIGISIPHETGVSIGVFVFFLATLIDFTILRSKLTSVSEALQRSVPELENSILTNLSEQKNSILGKITEQQEAQKVAHVGTSLDAFDLIEAEIVNATSVVRTDLGSYSPDGKSRIATVNNRWVEIYNKWLSLKSADSWTDIVGPSRLFTGLYTDIKPTKDIKAAHNIIVLRHSTPIINFIKLTLPNEREVIYFGWIDGRKGEPIFRSEDKDTIKVFNRQLEKLTSHRTWGDTISVEYKYSSLVKRLGRGYLVDKLGSWVTLSVRKGKIETYGFFEISITKEKVPGQRPGQLIFKGNVFDRDLKPRAHIRHSEREVAHYANRVFIEYTDFANQNSGHCFYEFNSTGLDEIDSDEIRGFFIDEDDDTRSFIYGFRADIIQNVATLDAKEFYEQRAVAAQQVLDGLLKKGQITQLQYDDAKLYLKKETVVA